MLTSGGRTSKEPESKGKGKVSSKDRDCDHVRKETMSLSTKSAAKSFGQIAEMTKKRKRPTNVDSSSDDGLGHDQAIDRPSHLNVSDSDSAASGPGDHSDIDRFDKNNNHPNQGNHNLIGTTHNHSGRSSSRSSSRSSARVPVKVRKHKNAPARTRNASTSSSDSDSNISAIIVDRSGRVGGRRKKGGSGRSDNSGSSDSSSGASSDSSDSSSDSDANSRHSSLTRVSASGRSSSLSSLSSSIANETEHQRRSAKGDVKRLRPKDSSGGTSNSKSGQPLLNGKSSLTNATTVLNNMSPPPPGLTSASAFKAKDRSTGRFDTSDTGKASVKHLKDKTKNKKDDSSSTKSFSKEKVDKERVRNKDVADKDKDKERDKSRKSDKTDRSKKHDSDTRKAEKSSKSNGDVKTKDSRKEKSMKKEAITSTTISFSNNNNTGMTTLEIKSVKNVKMSEVKKSADHNGNDAGSLNNTSSGNAASPLTNRSSNPDVTNDWNDLKGSRSRPAASRLSEESPLSSPDSLLGAASSGRAYASKMSGMNGTIMDSSPPVHIGMTAAPSSKLSESYERIMADMRTKKRELSPLSSDGGSERHYPIMNGRKSHKSRDGRSSRSGMRDHVDDEDDLNENGNHMHNGRIHHRMNGNAGEELDDELDDDDDDDDGDCEGDNGITDSGDELLKSEHALYVDAQLNGTGKSSSRSIRSDLAYVNELIMLQRQLSELQDADLLQQVVNIIEDSGLFELTSTSVDFDLMRLDRSTVRRIKSCLS